MIDQFIPTIVEINIVYPTYYLPQVVMQDGAIQWSGTRTLNKEAAMQTAIKAAKSYNEA
jgi:hypothetical protein